MHPASQGIILNGKTQQDKPGDCCRVTFLFSFFFFLFASCRDTRSCAALFFRLGIFCLAVTAHVLVLQVDKQAKHRVITNDRGRESSGQLMLLMRLDVTSRAVGDGRSTACSIALPVVSVAGLWLRRLRPVVNDDLTPRSLHRRETPCNRVAVGGSICEDQIL